MVHPRLCFPHLRPARAAAIVAAAAACVLLSPAGSQAGMVPSGGRAPAATLSLTAESSPAATSSPTWWVPVRGAGWQIQYSGAINLSVPVPTYDLDGFDTPAASVDSLHAAGRRAICYLSVGSWEDWRSDAASYPASVLGASNGWPGERWVDIRQTSVLKPILDRRFNMCRAKGFDAVDPDNVDGYTNRTGFSLTGADQLAFNRWLAAEVHAYGMSVGLKNDLDQVPDLVGAFDFAVNEQCFQYSECGAVKPFTAAGKAVLHIEYSTDPAAYCPITKALGFSSIKKHLDLDAWRRPC